MRKIPTLFVRDPEDLRYVTREVHPDCQWVIDGEGVATRKYDGTCVMFDGERWWARREVKNGRIPPPGFQPVDQDHTTGKVVGWEPIEQSAFARFHTEALLWLNAPRMAGRLVAGTYELVGPKVNGNPERQDLHQLWAHASAEVETSAPRDFDDLAAWLADYAGEGLVWHHPDGRMAKLKARDFPR